jgi:hypothetical protein
MPQSANFSRVERTSVLRPRVLYASKSFVILDLGRLSVTGANFKATQWPHKLKVNKNRPFLTVVTKTTQLTSHSRTWHIITNNY